MAFLRPPSVGALLRVKVTSQVDHDEGSETQLHKVDQEALRIECGTSILSGRFVRVMDQLLALYGKHEAKRK